MPNDHPQPSTEHLAPAGLDAWLAHLERLHPQGQAGIELGLERVRRVKDALGQTPFCPLIIVGGTNGKGSTCAYLEAIYASAGYSVGCYTSPHLLVYNERVRVDRRSIDDAALCRAFANVEAARIAAGEVALTYFEFGTLAAWEAFAAAGVEVMILEVGLGGRLDAVNVHDADCAIVTGVALDHVDWLGATREAIGFEKAGIFRAGEGGRRQAICADADPPQTLIAHAQAIGADLKLIGRDFSARDVAAGWVFEAGGELSAPLPLPALAGTCQLGNAAAALAAVRALAPVLPVDAAALARGLSEIDLAARFQVIARPGRAPLILDVAHNPQAAAVLADNLARRPCAGQTLAVVGMLADKDIAGVLESLAGLIDHWFVAGLAVARGAPAARLTGVLDRVLDGVAAADRVACFASPQRAYAQAAKVAGENDRIVAFGSFHTVAAVLQATREEGD